TRSPERAPKRHDDLHAAVGNAHIAARLGRRVLVDPGEPLAAGQIHADEFMDHVSDAVTELASRELAAFGRSAEDCPYLDHWLTYFRTQPAAKIERSLRLYAHPT